MGMETPGRKNAAKMHYLWAMLCVLLSLRTNKQHLGLVLVFLTNLPDQELFFELN